MSAVTSQSNVPRPDTLLSAISTEQARAVFQANGVVPHLWSVQGYTQPEMVSIELLGKGRDLPQQPDGSSFEVHNNAGVVVISSGILSDRVASKLRHIVIFSDGATVRDLADCLALFRDNDSRFLTTNMDWHYNPVTTQREHDLALQLSRGGSALYPERYREAAQDRKAAFVRNYRF